MVCDEKPKCFEAVEENSEVFEKAFAIKEVVGSYLWMLD